MSVEIESKNSAMEYLKWSIIATAVVTILFIIIDILLAESLSEATTWQEGITMFLKVSYSYFVSAIVTSVLTLLIQCHIAPSPESVGVNGKNTPIVMLVWFVYVVFYFIYLKYYDIILVGIIYLGMSIAFVYFLLQKWIDKISIPQTTDGCQNIPM